VDTCVFGHFNYDSNALIFGYYGANSGWISHMRQTTGAWVFLQRAKTAKSGPCKHLALTVCSTLILFSCCNPIFDIFDWGMWKYFLWPKVIEMNHLGSFKECSELYQ
jgi:hypothetical protein